MLDEILLKYIDYQFYFEIERLLLAIKEGYALKCFYGYADIKTTKKEMKKRILTEINGYTLRRKQLEELKYDKKISPQIIESLEKTLVFEDKFNKIYNQIDN